MTRRARRSVVTSLAMATAVAALGGCSALPWLTQQQECVSWVTFDDQESLAASSQLIVVGTVIERSGTADLLGGDARLYRFDVEQSSDPDLEGSEIEIASRADGCAEDPYGFGDQLDTDERIAVFLSTDEQWDGFATVTPFDGVLPADELQPGLEPGLAAPSPSSE